jgi:hypothetical protein
MWPPQERRRLAFQMVTQRGDRRGRNQPACKLFQRLFLLADSGAEKDLRMMLYRETSEPERRKG